MPIEILAGMVVVGLALAIVAVRFSGLSRVAVIDSPAQAQSRFVEEFTDESVRDCRVAADRNAAFLLLQSGSCGILIAFGSKFVARMIEPALGTAAVQGTTLKLRSGDFTFPKSSYGLASAKDASTVAAWLNGEKP